MLVLSGATLITVWGLLSRLVDRAPGASVPLGIALAIQSGGIAVMLAGYLSGGEAAIPPAAAIAGAAMASVFLKARLDARGAVGLGAVTLFALLFIGRYFGELTTARALTLMIAPLLAWLPELLRLRDRPRLAATLRILCVAVGLALVLFDSKRQFDREMRPLLGVAEGLHARLACRCERGIGGESSADSAHAVRSGHRHNEPIAVGEYPRKHCPSSLSAAAPASSSREFENFPVHVRCLRGYSLAEIGASCFRGPPTSRPEPSIQ